MEIDYEIIGWKTKISQKRASFGITINKLVATGAGLVKGKELFCYSAKDCNGRPIIIVFLDGKEKGDVSAPSKTRVISI